MVLKNRAVGERHRPRRGVDPCRLGAELVPDAFLLVPGRLLALPAAADAGVEPRQARRALREQVPLAQRGPLVGDAPLAGDDGDGAAKGRFLEGGVGGDDFVILCGEVARGIPAAEEEGADGGRGGRRRRRGHGWRRRRRR